MLQVFFVIICLFLVLCQYVISTSDSNAVSEREHIHDDNIHSAVQSCEVDNVVLHYYPTPGENGFFNVVYHTKTPDNHYVFKDVFWYQTISIPKQDLDSFYQCFSRHISECCHAHPLERESVNICEYSFCKRDCRMFSFENKFLSRGIKKYTSSVLPAIGKEIMLKNFFNGGRHARKEKWEDFFSVIRNNFVDPLTNDIIYSEGKDVNHDFTYLYLLTNRFMYELGYNLKNKSLFLMRIDLMVLALHCGIGSEFLKNNNKYSFEMPFDMIFDSQKEGKQENVLQYKNVENIKGSSQQYSDDIKRSTLLEHTMRNVKVAKKNKSKTSHILNNEKEWIKTHAACNSLKHSEMEDGFVINKRTEFEENFWEDIKSVYNDKKHKVDFEYYKREMPLQ